MKAIILAAGRGRRLGPNGSEQPKCLYEVADKALLTRMLGSLRAVGVNEAIIVVGYMAEAIESLVESIPLSDRPEVSFLNNKNWKRGSILSLWRAHERFGEEDAIIMDADVLYPVQLLERLVKDAPQSSFLLDPRAEQSGEEMMLMAREGRVLRISRRIEPQPGDKLGEGVGFLKLIPADQHLLAEELKKLVEQEELDRDYEDAIDAFLSRTTVGYAEVADLPWTEIDFSEDLERARTEIYPSIRALDLELTA